MSLPKETRKAIEYALSHCEDVDGWEYCVVDNGEINKHFLVSTVRDYFNKHSIEYSSFSYSDLEPFLN